MTAKFESPLHPHCLQGKVALVTGGGSGIGYEITRQLLLHGCQAAVICGRRPAFLQRAAASLANETNRQVEFQVCDVRNEAMCKAVMEFVQQLFGRLDILVNGAAGNFLAQAESLSSKGFATVMNIDAVGTFNMSRHAFSLLQKSGEDAVVINISATLHHGATWWQAHASAAKAAVDSLTRSLGLEWGSSNIRVVGIAPGPIADTPGTTKLAPGLSAKDVESMVVQGIPVGRMGRAEEIGQAAVYLASARFITGATLVVDGGERLYREPMVPKDMVSELSRKVEAKSRAQAPNTGRSKL